MKRIKDIIEVGALLVAIAFPLALIAFSAWIIFFTDPWVNTAG